MLSVNLTLRGRVADVNYMANWWSSVFHNFYSKYQTINKWRKCLTFTGFRYELQQCLCQFVITLLHSMPQLYIGDQLFICMHINIRIAFIFIRKVSLKKLFVSGPQVAKFFIPVWPEIFFTEFWACIKCKCISYAVWFFIQTFYIVSKEAAIKKVVLKINALKVQAFSF